MFLFFICISLSGVVLGLFETGCVVFECRRRRTACASSRPQRPASYSPNRHNQINHFVILKIACGEAPRISTCPALFRSEQSRRPHLDQSRFLASVVAPALRHRGSRMCRVACMLHQYLAFQLRRNFTVDHAKKLAPCAVISGRALATSALEDSFELPPSRRIHDPANRCSESAKPDNSSGSPRSAEPSPMAFRSSPASSRSAPVRCPRARSAMTKPDHAPPATKDRLDVPAAITGCLSVRFNRWRSTRT